MGRRAGVLRATLGVVLIGGCVAHGPDPLLRDDFASYPAGEPWPEGALRGPWRTVFHGYGRVGVEPGGRDQVLALRPRAATDRQTTHAALVVSDRAFTDCALTARLQTRRRIRRGVPAAWEVAWLVFRYQDPQHFYYLALKPGGWELGKADPTGPGGQRFLRTGPQRFPLRRWHEATIEGRGDRLRVRADGELLAEFTDTDAPYLQGAVGFYTEDASVAFDEVSVVPSP